MRIPLMALAAMLLLQSACSTRHEVQMAPVEVKPIHITIDVNVRVQKDLEDFFSDIDKADQKLNPSN
ncbi:YnbE-like lipoprotein [Desulfomicrobium apsheronum]|uniref:YnbE-like lipoprotein n=1 Tax=Desulfomicrobium apsheronum TaxID=52560 RepID=A0A1I3VKI2_9BACT|nr:YnbE family lipoprotein [Desulfomicrobium apsheronum]MDY0225530.1 YnbE family lipoprotein [Desulfomicrobium apsheronum]SFJ95569.1 YnbE-like lipoprotein [Desulfomicrobium apsheronum]